MLPGKTYSTDEILRIALRRLWMIVIPLVVGACVAYGVSRLLPTRYRSETLIMVMPQRIPDTYVKSTITATLEDRLATLNDQILSRSRLERIILDLNLYAKLRGRLPMEVVVQRMRDDVAVKLEGNVKESQSFRLSYISDDAMTAQKTTERLASLFIEENLRDRENQAENTNQFLDSQLEDAKRRLIGHEKKLEEFRSRYSGELPTQASANLQAIQAAQLQLQTLGDTADRARERRLLLERELVDLQDPDPIIAALTTAAAPARNGQAGG